MGIFDSIAQLLGVHDDDRDETSVPAPAKPINEAKQRSDKPETSGKITDYVFNLLEEIEGDKLGNEDQKTPANPVKTEDASKAIDNLKKELAGQFYDLIEQIVSQSRGKERPEVMIFNFPDRFMNLEKQYSQAASKALVGNSSLLEPIHSTIHSGFCKQVDHCIMWSLMGRLEQLPAKSEFVSDMAQSLNNLEDHIRKQTQPNTNAKAQISREER